MVETSLVRLTVLACMLREGIGNSGSVGYRRYVLLDLPAFPASLLVTASTIDCKSIVVPVAHGGSFKVRCRLDQRTDHDCRAGIARAILMHFLRPWRSDAGGTSPRMDEVERSRKPEPRATQGAVAGDKTLHLRKPSDARKPLCPKKTHAPPRTAFGRVDDWRGNHRPWGVAVAGHFRQAPVPHSGP